MVLLIMYMKDKIMDKNVIIRLEKRSEERDVENLIREAFWNLYRPGCLEHFVMHQLRSNPDFVKKQSAFLQYGACCYKLAP